ncbi:hypothetical protein [Streptomyces sp. NPDC058451]|uniref:hypothetical protein n=1 Tax=Streptomyces sp. NPDC058451 TaxID=3346506 RepID=UPI003660FA12
MISRAKRDQQLAPQLTWDVGTMEQAVPHGWPQVVGSVGRRMRLNPRWIQPLVEAELTSPFLQPEQRSRIKDLHLTRHRLIRVHRLMLPNSIPRPGTGPLKFISLGEADSRLRLAQRTPLRYELREITTFTLTIDRPGDRNGPLVLVAKEPMLLTAQLEQFPLRGNLYTLKKPVRPIAPEDETVLDGLGAPRRAAPCSNEQQAQQDHDFTGPEGHKVTGGQYASREQNREHNGHGGARESHDHR